MQTNLKKKMLLKWPICSLWASELLVDRDLGIIYSPADIMMVDEPKSVTVAIKYDLGDAGDILHHRCPNVDIPYVSMEQRVLAGSNAFNNIVAKRYPGFKYVTGSGSKAHYDQKVEVDEALTSDELLIAAKTPAQIRSKLSQCSRKDTTCLFEPTIRSRRIGYVNLASQTTFALLPCQLAEDGQTSSKCNILAPHSICCAVSGEKSNCGLEASLAAARSLVKNWLSQNPRARVIWQSRPDSRVTKINASRMAFCFSATLAHQNGQTVLFGEPVLEDQGRAWTSTYYLDDSEEATTLSEAQASALTSQLWSILPEPAIPGLPSLNLPSRKSRQKQSLMKASGSVNTDDKGRITAGSLAVAKLGDKSHSSFAARYYDKYKDSFSGVMRAIGSSDMLSRRKGRKGRRHRRELPSAFLSAVDRQQPGYWGVETRKMLVKSPHVTKWTQEAKCSNITYEALMKEVPNQVPRQVDVFGILMGTSSVTEEFLDAIDRAGLALFKRGCKGYPPSYLSRNMRELIYRLNFQPVPPNWLEVIQSVRKRRSTTIALPSNETVASQSSTGNSTGTVTESMALELPALHAVTAETPTVTNIMEPLLVQNDDSHDKSLRFMLMNKRTLPPNHLVYEPEDSFLMGNSVLQVDAEMGDLHAELCSGGATANSIGTALLKRLSKIEDKIHHLQEELQRQEIPGDIPVGVLQAVCAHNSDASQCDSEVLMQGLTKAAVSGAYLLDHSLSILIELEVQIPVQQNQYQIMRIDTIPHFEREPGNGTDRFRAVQIVNLPPVLIMDINNIELYATHLEGCVATEQQLVCEKNRLLTNLNTKGTLCAKAVYLGLDDEISSNCRREMVDQAITDFNCLTRQVRGGLIVSVEDTKQLDMKLVSNDEIPVSATDTCTDKVCVVQSTVEAHFNCGNVEVRSVLDQEATPIKYMDSGLEIEDLIDQRISDEILGKFTSHQYAGANTTFLITTGFAVVLLVRVTIRAVRKLLGVELRRLCLIARWSNNKRKTSKATSHRPLRGMPTAQQIHLNFLRSISPSNSGTIYSK